MKVIKHGKKRFKELYKIEIYRCSCGECGAMFEAQSGELGRESCGYLSFRCPSCRKFHSDYTITHIRDEEVEFKDVVGYDCLVNTHRTIEV